MGGPISQCCCPPGTADFKVVGALVTWFGLDDGAMYGYENCIGVDWNNWDTEPCTAASPCTSYIPYSATPPPHKWLGKTEDIVWDASNLFERRNTCPAPVPDAYTTETVIHFVLHRDDHVDRYTGITTSSFDALWSLVITDSRGAGYSGETELTGQDAIDAATAAFCPYLSAAALCGQVLTVPNVTTAYPEVFRDLSDSNIKLVAELVTDSGWEAFPCPAPNNITHPLGQEDRTVYTGRCSCDVIKYDKFTAAEVWAMAVELLAQWPFSNDTNYPWRTACAGSSYRYGPLVQHDYSGVFSGVPGAIIGAPYSTDTWDAGAHSHPGYVLDGASGGTAIYIQAPNVWGWDSNSLILGKWAEKKITVPHHNYARPCGVDYWNKVTPSDYNSDLCWPPASMVNILRAGVTPSDGDTVTIYNTDSLDTTTYTWKTTPGALPEVAIGADATAAILNLKNAINTTNFPVGVAATVSGTDLTLTDGAATRYYHFHETTSSNASILWDQPRMTGPVCAAPCNNTTSINKYVTIESVWDYRLFGEAVRINTMDAACGGYSPCTADDQPCFVTTDCPVPSLWTNTCTLKAAVSVGDVLYCSPNGETFSGASVSHTFPAALALDDWYGNVGYNHIRQAMPDPLLAACPTVTSWVMEEAECATTAGCTALPAPGIFYCPDETTSAASGCYVQDEYGMQCPPA